SGLYAGVALATRPITSPAYDVFNKKNILGIALLLTALSFFIISMAKGIPLILVGRAVQGLGIGVASPISLSIALGAVPSEQYGKGVAIYSLAQAFGQAIGPSIGLALTSRLGYNKVFFICGVLMVISSALTRMCGDTYVAPGARYRIRFDTILLRQAVPASLLLILLMMSYSSISSMVTIYGGLLSVENIGLYFTVYAVGLLVFRPITSGLADRHGYVKVLVPALVVFAITFVFLGSARSLTLILAAAVAAALGYGVCLPTAQAMCMKTAPKERSGIASNTMFFMQDIGLFAGPFIWGLVIDAFKSGGASDVEAYSRTFFLAVIPVLIMAVLAIVFKKVLYNNFYVKNKEEDGTDQPS
ncbi:MAG: MFS transporter, partial [Firmicutes bacterium]|nr:MFS transporter [Bacillota bacterium]